MQIYGNCETITQTKFTEKGTNIAHNHLDIQHSTVRTKHPIFNHGS